MIMQEYIDIIHRLTMAIEFRDIETGQHTRRVGEYTKIIVDKLGLDFGEMIKEASPMHDLGKVGIADDILKKPGKLTFEEFETVKQHTIIGAKILGDSNYPLLKMACEIALTHHEKWNGMGYPHKLAGNNIPITGRITAVADVFDTLISHRCYKVPYSFEKAIEILKRDSESHFDRSIVEAFLSEENKVNDIYTKYQEN